MYSMINDTRAFSADIFNKDEAITDVMINSDCKELYMIADNLASMRSSEVLRQSTEAAKKKNQFIKEVAKKMFNREWSPEHITIEALKRKESTIGASLFYNGRSGERIEFFNDNRTSWFFYHSVKDRQGIERSSTLHYEVHPNGIMKISSASGMKCEFISGQEYDNFVKSANLYYDRVVDQLYRYTTDKHKNTTNTL